MSTQDHSNEPDSDSQEHGDHDHDHNHQGHSPSAAHVSYPPGSVTPQCVVALTWTLKDTTGDLLDELDEAVEFLVGGGDLLASIDYALQGHMAGDKIDVHLEPERAFGDYDEARVFLEPRKLFPAQLESGMVFEGLPTGCTDTAPKDLLYFVSDIYPDHVVMDGNHPLAGMALRLAVKLIAVRDATIEEVGRGSCGSGFFKIAPVVVPVVGNDTVH